jgi:DNA-damage-inducible protein J
MQKTEHINFRTDAGTKLAAEAVLRELGMKPSEALNLFYHQVALHQGLPFSLVLPNAETRQTFLETDSGENLQSFNSVDDFFTHIDAN